MTDNKNIENLLQEGKNIADSEDWESEISDEMLDNFALDSESELDSFEEKAIDNDFMEDADSVIFGEELEQHSSDEESRLEDTEDESEEQLEDIVEDESVVELQQDKLPASSSPNYFKIAMIVLGGMVLLIGSVFVFLSLKSQPVAKPPAAKAAVSSKPKTNPDNMKADSSVLPPVSLSTTEEKKVTVEETAPANTQEPVKETLESKENLVDVSPLDANPAPIVDDQLSKEDIQKIVRDELILATRDLAAQRTRDINNLKKELVATKKQNPVHSKPKPEDLNTGDRKRLKGFNVVNKSADGKMSIVKAPSERVITLYVGETIRVYNKSLTVTQIKNNGDLVFVGRRWFIDDVRIARPKPVAKKEAPISKDINKTVEEKVNEPEPVKKDDKPIKILEFVEEFKPVENPIVLENWSVVSFMNNGALIKTPKGEFLKVGYGEVIEGLGRIGGYRNDQKLYVGNYVILFNKP